MISIARLSNLTERERAALDSLGLESVEGVLSLLHVHASRAAFLNTSGITEAGLETLLGKCREVLPAAHGDLAPAPVEPMMLGLSCGTTIAQPLRPTRLRPFRAEAAAGLPAQASSIPALPPVRDQGRRGTCVAFAATAALEHEFNSRGWRRLFPVPGNGTGALRVRLSPQHLYWACKQRDLSDGPGTTIGTAMRCLNELGCVPEGVWPYNPAPTQGNEGQGPPPRGTGRGPAPFRSRSHAVTPLMTPQAMRDVKGLLARGRVLPFGVPVFPSWGNVETQRTGRIIMPIPGERSLGGHAMCLCGYRDDDSRPGGGVFLLRNSWGTSWATDNPLGAGYGELPYAYLAMYGRDVASVDALHACDPQQIRTWALQSAKTGAKAAAVAAVVVGLLLTGSLAAIALRQQGPVQPAPGMARAMDQDAVRPAPVLNHLDNVSRLLDEQ